MTVSQARTPDRGVVTPVGESPEALKNVDRSAVRRHVVPALVVLVGLIVWRSSTGAWLSVAVLVAAVLVLVGASVWKPQFLSTLVSVVGGAAASVVRSITFVVLALPMVVLPWAIAAISRVDPLAASGGWTRRRRTRGSRSGMWAPDSDVVPWWRRMRRNLTGVAMVVLAVGGLFVLRGNPHDEVVVPAAFEDAGWYPEYSEDIDWVMSSANFNPLADVHIRDVSTRHVNVADGRRATWSPPECGTCQRLRVWVYGGSTAFGVGQRDDHTIPSELSRVAWENGYALDVENRGGPGDSHWDAAKRMAWDLSGSDVPDLVASYDGINEVQATYLELDPVEPSSHVRPRFWDAFTDRFPLPTITPPVGAQELHRGLPNPSAADEWASVIVERYLRARQVSASAGAGAEVLMRYFWQPSIEHRDAVEGEQNAGGLQWSRERSDAMIDLLPDDVEDLSAVFDGVDQPLFYDGVHTNELGARIVAEAIFEHLRPDLDRLTAGRSASEQDAREQDTQG